MKSILKILLLILVINTDILICQTVSESWVQKPDLLTGRVYIYPALYNNKIFAIGGGFYDVSTGGDFPIHSNIVEEYDLTSNVWQKKSNIPSGTGGYIVQMNDRIFVFGRNNKGVAEEYLPDSDTWQTISGTTKFLWTGLPVCEMIAFQNKVYAFSYSLGNSPGNISVFDPSTSNWTTVGKMNSARSWFRLAVVKDRIYVLEGSLNDIPTQASLKMVEEYNPATNEWIPKNSLQVARHEIAVSTYNNKIYVFGGHDVDGNHLNIVEEYDPEKQQSVIKQNIPYNAWGSSAITVNNKLYVLGGIEDEDNESRNFYEYNPDLDIQTAVQSNGEEEMMFRLFQNYPNPFNPVTQISYQLPVFSYATLKVYDVLGNEVATLVNEEKAPGYYQVKFDGSSLASGVYFYKIKAGNFAHLKKMLIIK